MIHVRCRRYGEDWTDVWFDGDLEDDLSNLLVARLHQRPDIELDLEPQED